MAQASTNGRFFSAKKIRKAFQINAQSFNRRERGEKQRAAAPLDDEATAKLPFHRIDRSSAVGTADECFFLRVLGVLRGWRFLSLRPLRLPVFYGFGTKPSA